MARMDSTKQHKTNLTSSNPSRCGIRCNTMRQKHRNKEPQKPNVHNMDTGIIGKSLVKKKEEENKKRRWPDDKG